MSSMMNSNENMNDQTTDSGAIKPNTLDPLASTVAPSTPEKHKIGKLWLWTLVVIVIISGFSVALFVGSMFSQKAASTLQAAKLPGQLWVYTGVKRGHGLNERPVKINESTLVQQDTQNDKYGPGEVGLVTGINTATGRTRWSTTIERPKFNDYVVPPFNVVHLNYKAYFEDYDTIQGIDIKTGQKELLIKVPDLLRLEAGESYIYAYTEVSGSGKGTIKAIAPQSGKVVWSTELSGSLKAWVYDSERLFISKDDGTILALNGSTGGDLWTIPSTGSKTSDVPLFIKGGTLIYSTWYKTATYGVDKVTGRALWNTPTYITSGAIAGSDLVFGETGKGTAAVDPATGKELWSIPYRALVKYASGNSLYASVDQPLESNRPLESRLKVLSATSGAVLHTPSGVISEYFFPYTQWTEDGPRIIISGMIKSSDVLDLNHDNNKVTIRSFNKSEFLDSLKSN